MLVGRADAGNPDTTLDGCGDAGESLGARAHLSFVLSHALGVGSARVAHCARVVAFSLNADILSRAVGMGSAPGGANTCPAGLSWAALLGGYAGSLALA